MAKVKKTKQSSDTWPPLASRRHFDDDRPRSVTAGMNHEEIVSFYAQVGHAKRTNPGSWMNKFNW